MCGQEGSRPGTHVTSHTHAHVTFAKMMFQGKTQAALQLLTDQGKGGLLHLDDPVTPSSTVKDVLLSKHPPSNPASPDTLETEVPQEVHPVVFDAIDAALIRSTALNTKGAAARKNYLIHTI